MPIPRSLVLLALVANLGFLCLGGGSDSGEAYEPECGLPSECDQSWYGHPGFEGACKEEWNGNGQCDCGCQWEDSDCPAGLSLPPVRRVFCEDGSEVEVQFEAGSAGKVCQLTGEIDRQLDQPTLNRTESRFSLKGTDLGVSFEHDGGLFFMFGDTVPSGTTHIDGDATAFTRDADPSNCLDLTFTSDGDVSGAARYRAPQVPGIDNGGCEVPMEGVSIDGTIFGYFTTDSQASCDMGRSIVATSTDNGRTWNHLYDFSSDRFINVSVVRATREELNVPGYEDYVGDWLLIWGSGKFRKSDLYFAIQPTATASDPSTIRFYSGNDAASCYPDFSQNEADAVGLLGASCIGELSVFYAPTLERWIALYNCDSPDGIVFSSARWPWGPWSAPKQIFRSQEGLCRFIHGHSVDQPACDDVDDPAPGELAGHGGGVYAPYVLPTFVGGAPGEANIFFTMSTWNPYQVVLMKARLVANRLGPDPGEAYEEFVSCTDRDGDSVP